MLEYTPLPWLDKENEDQCGWDKHPHDLLTDSHNAILMGFAPEMYELLLKIADSNAGAKLLLNKIHNHASVSEEEPEKTYDPGKDVHTEHCCGEHKVCKYGEEDSGCTVCSGFRKASHPCNCDWM